MDNIIKVHWYGVGMHDCWNFNKEIWPKMAVDSIEYTIDCELGSHLCGPKCLLYLRGEINSRIFCCRNIWIWSIVFGWNLQWQVLTINISNRLNLPNFPMHFSVRGACGSFLFLAVNFGVVIAFTLGAYCNYHVTPLFAIAINVLFVALFLVFPETPLFLMKQKRISVRLLLIHLIPKNFITNYSFAAIWKIHSILSKIVDWRS